MRSNFNKFILTLLVLSFGWMVSMTTFAASDPVGMLQSVANNMIAGLKANKANLKNKPQVVYSLAYRYVVPHAAISEMAKGVLPPNIWNNATPAQRAEFQKQFTRILIRTYASALSSYDDQTVKFFPVRGGGGSEVDVRSQIVSSDHDPIDVSYHLINVGGSWKLYDLSVEGVSMLESFRSQFSDILSSGSMDELLSRMSAHRR